MSFKMDGEVQPKFGLMVSLILMNLTAIALFFFATPTSSAMPKKQVKQEDNVSMVQTEMVMAGDADSKIVVEDEKVTAMSLSDGKMEAMEESVVALKKSSRASMKSPQLSLGDVKTLSPQYSLVEAQTIPGKVEMRVLDVSSNSAKKTCEMETSCRRTEPPLAIALKKFVGNTSSGVRIFFEGLKNGYAVKRHQESEASNTSIKKSVGTAGVIENARPSLRDRLSSNNSTKKSEGAEGVIENARPSLQDRLASNISTKMSKVMEGVIGSTRPSLEGSKNINPHSSQKIQVTSHGPSSTQNFPQPTTSISGSLVDGSSLSHETIPTELVLDVLSQTQRRTNELINMFSKKVIPAIERMNVKVAEAIRLEKNLDSYTACLINAINSLVCPNADEEMNVKRKSSKSAAGAMRKLKHSNPFCSDMSLMRDSRILDYVGAFSKGEISSRNKRPVFKTLAARCWHTRYKKILNKANKKHTKRSDELIMPKESGLEFQESEQEKSRLRYDMHQGVLQQNDNCVETKDDQESIFNHIEETPIDNSMSSGVCEGYLNSTGFSHKRTIGIEEVLALTSCEQSSDQGVESDADLLSFLSPLNINSKISMYSGMASRSFEPSERLNFGHYLIENESTKAQLNSERTESHESALTQSPVLPEDPTEQAGQQEDALGSDFSIVCGSRIQGYDSYLVPKQISTAATCSSENEETQLSGPSQTSATDGMTQLGESNQSISLSGEIKNTIELVNVFRQLNCQQKESAIENVCLLVLRIFEAWTDPQRPISSQGLSRISSPSWPSADQMSSHSSRPRTAICRPRKDSGPEQKAIGESSLPNDDASKGNKPSEPTSNQTTLDSSQESAEISRDFLQNVVEAAEVQIAERSLMGLKTNLLRSPPLKGDLLKSSINPANVNQSGFGDIKDTIIADEELAVALTSKSLESVKVSKESSTATFYTGQPESSEDAFYECVSTLSAGTCGSLELEVKDSSTLFLERIEEEESRLHKNEGDVGKATEVFEPQTVRSAFSIESWLTDSGEELHTAKDALNSEEFPVSDSSSLDIASGTDDEALPCSSQDLSADESKAKKKKSKWAAKLFRKFLKKKAKPSSFPSVALSKSASKSLSDSVLKLHDQNLVQKDDDSTQ